MAVALLSPEVHAGGGHDETGDELLVIERQREKRGFERQSGLNGSCIPKLLYTVSAGAASTPADLQLLPCRPWRGDHNPAARLTVASAA